MKFLGALDRLLVRIETIFLVVFLSLMVLLAFAQVVLRNVFGGGIIWGDPLVRQMVMWSGFMGAAIAASQDRHISIDALTQFIKGRGKDIVRFVTSIFASVVCFYLAQAALVFLKDEKESGGELIAGIPSWIGLIIIPAGYALLMIHFALNAVGHAAKAVSPAAGEAR
jgi:TRAP-type C4-dicarboxylate transport system permease small subunit